MIRRRRVVLDLEAIEDLRQIGRWVSERAGATVARRYLARIRAFCQGLDVVSERGARRDDLRPGLRIVAFERRVTVAFAVMEDRVVVLRIFYGGRDIDSILGAVAEDE